MTVMNRRQEIALLLALGASKSEIKRSFFYQGLVIGGSGIIFGLVLGFLGLFLLGNFNILELSTIDLVLIVVGAVFIVAISSYYPAKKATEVNVLQTLRNE